MDFPKRLSVCFKLHTVTPGHVYFIPFVGMVPLNDHEYEDYRFASRGRTLPPDTQMCLRIEEFVEWLERYPPNMIAADYDELLQEGCFEDVLKPAIEKQYKYYGGNAYNPQCYILKNT